MKRQNSKTAGGPQKKAKKGDGESTQKTVKKERKKTAQYAEKLVKDMNVACTGARCGEVIQGYRCTAAGAVAKGDIIPPRTKELDSLRAFPEVWERFLEKLGSLSFFSKMTVEERKKWLEDNESSVDMDIAEIEGCEVELLQLGKSNFLDLEEEQIDQILSTGSMLAKDIRDMFPRKPGSTGIRGRQTLIFYRQYWRVVVTHKQANDHTGFVIDVENGKSVTKAKADKDQTILIFEDMPKTLKKCGRTWEASATHSVGFLVPEKGMKWDSETVNDIIVELHECQSEELADIRKSLRQFTCAGYKSLLQKIVRFAPKKIKAGTTSYPADLVISVVVGELLLSPGSFVPDIQRFVSGLESLAKRLMVIYFEDSFVDEATKASILTLSSCAFLAQRVKSWKPSRDLVVSFFQLALKAWKENSYFEWKTPEGAALTPYTLVSTNDALQLASALLDEVKSFGSDLAMVRYIAKNYSSTKRTNKDFKRPEEMHLSHCIDQHWTPEIVYFYPYSKVVENKVSGSQPYSKLFSRLFKEVTGVNPRKKPGFDPVKFEQEAFVKTTRTAQKLVLQAKQNVPVERKKIPGDSYKLDYTLDKSWIAGMVGAIEIPGRTTILTTLQPEDPEQIIAIKKPSRDMKNAQLTPEQEENAINATRKKLTEGVPLNKTKAPIPSLQGAKLVLRETEEVDSDEELDGETKGSDSDEDGKNKKKKKAKKEDKPMSVHREYFLKVKNKGLVKWEDVRDDSVEVAYVEDMSPAMAKALSTFGDGMQKNAWEELENTLKSSKAPVIRRALMYISGFRSNFEMGRVSRDGGGSKQAVIVEDVGAYQLLIVLSVLFPAALRRQKGSATVFEVPLAPLLWRVREKIGKYLAEDVEYNSKQWGNVADTLDRTPWQHQLDSLEEMKAAHHRGRKGHFIWIPVGMGKTWIVLSYIKFLMTENKLPRYVVYTLPSSAIKSIIHEVESFGFKVNLIVPTKSASAHPLIKYVRHPGKDIVDEFTLNLIEHDDLRKCEEALCSIAPQSIFIIDEVHKALNDTKRTSVALALSHLAEEFIALTGTPIIDSNTYKLIWWLEQIVPFEVNERNFWVAANGMVAKKVNTGVIVEREEVIADMEDAEKDAYIKLVPPGLGGKNGNFSPKNLRDAIELCYDVCSRQMVDITVKRVKEGSGVMVVAHTSAHQEKLKKGLVKKGIKEKDIFVLAAGKSIFLTDQTVEDKKEHDYKVVITTIRKSEGYTLTRLNTLVTSVYPSNNATREQIEGRVNRIGQKSKSVTFFTVHVGILSYILKKHKDARNLSAVLETLADEIKFVKGTGEFC